MTSTVLVTGATGFIGRHLVPALAARGFAVHALVPLFEPLPDTDSAQWHHADFFDRAAMRQILAKVGPSHLLHMAWNTKHGVFWKDPDNLDWLAASLSLVRDFAAAGGARVVMAGSCAEYDWSQGLCDENTTTLRPGSLYGTAKKALFETLASYGEITGLSWAWGRVFFLFGPGEQETRFIPYLIKSALLNQPAVCRFGQLQRDYMFVGDVASAFAALVASNVTGPVNIASGEAPALGDIAGTIGRLGHNQGTLTVLAEPPAPTEPPRLVAAVDRLHNEVGWRPAYSLESGLAETVNWWRGRLDTAKA